MFLVPSSLEETRMHTCERDLGRGSYNVCKDVVASFSQKDRRKNPKFSVKFGSRKS